MFNVCPGCGHYSVDKAIDPAGPAAICPRCGHAHPFRQLPLFLITGASGSGKTSLCLALPTRLPECVVLEMDILWGAVPASPADDYRGYIEVWLRLAKNVAQSGRPVVLCGTALPAQVEPSPERRYLGPTHYLALVADDATLADRLRARPAWREAGDEAFVARMVAFNRWLIDHAAATRPPLTLLDTSRASAEESAAAAAAWVRGWLERDRHDQAGD